MPGLDRPLTPGELAKLKEGFIEAQKQLMVKAGYAYDDLVVRECSDPEFGRQVSLLLKQRLKHGRRKNVGDP